MKRTSCRPCRSAKAEHPGGGARLGLFNNLPRLITAAASANPGRYTFASDGPQPKQIRRTAEERRWYRCGARAGRRAPAIVDVSGRAGRRLFRQRRVQLELRQRGKLKALAVAAKRMPELLNATVAKPASWTLMWAEWNGAARSTRRFDPAVVAKLKDLQSAGPP